MFIGHFAVAFAAKRVAPRTSLGALTAAANFLDLLWPVFVLVGLERFHVAPGITAYSPFAFDSYPWSHSLAMALVWSVLAWLLYRARTGDARGAIWIGALVFSHWVLDFATHRPDLQIAPGVATRVGLGLWFHPVATMVIEGGLFAAGVWVYVAGTRAKDRIGTLALWIYVVLLAFLYFATSSSPPPQDTRQLGMVTLVLFALLIPWASWFDRHREARVPA